jgi:hypothetical protein
MNKIYQEELFDDWKEDCHKLELLSGFVQNDLDRMLKDGMITKEDIKNSIVDFKEQYDKRIDHISELRRRIIDYLIKKSN